VFAFCYDKRTTGGESSVESGWCVAKLSSSLSWLERHTSLTDTLTTSFRRCLCYPLYRNWNLCNKVLDDTRWVFAQGRKQLLKALLEIHQLLLESEPRYILNQLYIDDMCVWIQQVDETVISSLREALDSVSVKKGDVGLDLEELEAAAGAVLEEGGGDAEDITGRLKGVNLDSDDDSSDSDDTEDSGDESDTDSSSDSDASSSACETETVKPVEPETKPELVG